MWRCLLGALFLLPFVFGGPRYSSRIVETQSGAIRGIILELNSRHLEPVEAFLGVPYAAPPLGDARYAPAGEPVPWSGTRLADAMPPVCPQKYPDISNITLALENMPRGRYLYLKRLIPLLGNQSENCLHLNIYVPGSGNRGVDAPYAVMVYIHGESYEWNAGNVYDGSVLASYGHVILVTVNFRLGILGFLKTRSGIGGTKDCCLATTDIEAALRWLKQNIAAFGGDTSRITLLGHDTGAALVNLLLLSKSAKGLFHRVALLSGSILSPWAIVQYPDAVRTEVGVQLGCPPSDDLAPCLRSLPISTLLGVDFSPPRFLPRYGPWLSSEPAYVLENAGDPFVSAQLLLGTTTTESYLDFNAADIQYGMEEDQRNRLLRTYVRNAYVYHLNEIFSTVRNEYTDWDKPILHPINIRDSTMEALSDGHTVAPLLRVSYLHSRRGAKTYFFHFNYQTKESDYPQRLGSVRGEDVTYILGLPLVGGQPYFPQNYTRQDLGVAEAVLTFFTNYAKTGDPNEPHIHRSDYGTLKEKSVYRGLTWDMYEPSTQLYLSIALKPRMKSHYRGHKMAVWLNLIPQLHQPGDEDVSMRHHHFHEKGNHFYAGSVRAESFTRTPPQLAPTTTPNNLPECEPNNTMHEDVEPQKSSIEEEEESLFQIHYESYNTALGVTVGVGCVLLLLNMLIFAGIFYRRDRKKRRLSTSSGEAGTDSIDLTPTAQYKKSPTIPEPPPPPRQCHPPTPPARTSSNPPTGIVKKRVQIQEISV